MAKTKKTVTIKRASPETEKILTLGVETVRTVDPASSASIEINRLRVSLKQCTHYRDNAVTRGNKTAANYWDVKVQTLNLRIAELGGV
jgi:hypothetical protein